MIFGNNKTNYGYWLASRGVNVRSYFAGFGPGNVSNGNAFSFSRLFYSNGGDPGWQRGYCLRPLISLTAEIPEGGELLSFSGMFGGGNGVHKE